MSHAAFSGGAGMRLGVYLPALAIFFAAAPSSCSSCFRLGSNSEFGWDFSAIDVLQPGFECCEAFELNMLERVATTDVAKRLHDFGRDEGSSLAPARELVDSAVREAESDLRKKWPGAKLTARMASMSLVAPFYEPGESHAEDIIDSVERLDRGHLAELVEEIAELHPDLASTLPNVEKLKADANKADKTDESEAAGIDLIAHFRMAWTDQRPAGKFKSAKELEQALLRVEPMKTTLRVVYEVVAPDGRVKKTFSDPVLAIEVVTLRFECDGEKWKAVSEAAIDDEAKKSKSDDR